MAKNTKIEWADHTWNPFYGCTKVSAGCKNCYAERDMKRFGKDFNTITRSKTTFNAPLKWHEPARVFVCSWGDFFHEDVPVEWRRDAWEIMFHAREHTFLILTKRPENMDAMLPAGWTEGMWKHQRNVWFGVTVENQVLANERIPLLLRIPAAKRFVSAEPMLGPVNIAPNWFVHSPEHSAGHIYKANVPGISWVIVGGESGPNCRPINSEWVIDIRNQCLATDMKFFFKQWGGKRKDPDGTWGGRMLEGREWSEFPA